MSIKLNVNQVMQYLPHRYPFLFVDAVDELVIGSHIIARKNVTVNEAMFNGHFPGNPVVPGVIQLEAMAQAAALLGLLGGALLDETKSIYVAAIDDARFRKPVIPGDVMAIHVKLVRNKMGIWKFAGKVEVGGEVASEANLTATVAPRVESTLPPGLPPPPRTKG